MSLEGALVPGLLPWPVRLGKKGAYVRERGVLLWDTVCPVVERKHACMHAYMPTCLHAHKEMLLGMK